MRGACGGGHKNCKCERALERQPDILYLLHDSATYS